jgi:hypothetical protein
VGELRGGPDEPEGGDRLGRDPPAADHGDTGAVRERLEPRSRAEYAADLEWQAAEQDVLLRFEPRRAGLPEVSTTDAREYLDKHQAERPWLATARDCQPEVQRIFVVLDQGGGHAHIRHEGWVTEEMNERRLRCLEDPSQLDPAARGVGIDGLAPGAKPHRCGSIATRITSPDAFAMAVAKGTEHKDVRAALGAEFRERRIPAPVVVPIADVLGPDGHRFCSGWQLEPVDGSMRTARNLRDAWASARAGPEPKTRRVETFEGGTATFTFGPNRARDGYEIVTMYVNPPEGPAGQGRDAR